MSVRSHFDPGTLAVMAITLILFIAALFFTGFTHDLLLEAGVFLVSVKLIVMAYKSSVAHESLQRKLDEILAAVRGTDGARDPAGRTEERGARTDPR